MIKQFLLGMWEFRCSVTTHFEDSYWYDWGREWAHRLTFRRYED